MANHQKMQSINKGKTQLMGFTRSYLCQRLDACMLIPAPLQDTLLRAAELEMYRLHWSDLILEDVKHNLIRRGMTSSVDA